MVKIWPLVSDANIELFGFPKNHYAEGMWRVVWTVTKRSFDPLQIQLIKMQTDRI